ELEFVEAGALLVVAALAVVLVPVDGAEHHDVGPLVLLVVLLFTAVTLARAVAGLAADAFHERRPKLLLVRPVLPDLRIAAGLAVARDVTDDAAGFLRVVLGRIELGLRL